MAVASNNPTPSANTGGQREVAVLPLALACTAIALNLLSSSRFLELLPFGDEVRLVSLAGIVAVSFSGIALCIILGFYIAAFVSFCLIVSIPFYSYIYSSASSAEFVPLSGGDYLCLGLLGIFVAVIKTGRTEALLKYIYALTICYCSVYLVTYLAIATGILVPIQQAHIAAAADEGSGRGVRIVLANSFVTFATCVAAVDLLRSRKLSAIFAIGLLLTCFYVAQSRTIFALIIISLILYLITQHSGLFRWIFFSVAAAGTIFTIYLILALNYNPFDGYINDASRASDVSAWARWRDIDIAHKLIPNHWLFGIGITNGPEGYKPITDVTYFFPQDIGLLGVFVNFGVFGLMFYMIQSYAACRNNIPEQFDRNSLKVGLGLAGAVLSVYGLIAPVFTGNGIIFGILFVGLLFRSGRKVTNF